VTALKKGSKTKCRNESGTAPSDVVWRNIRSFEKSMSKSIVKMPKGYLRDSGLLHYLLKIDSHEKMLRHPKTGAAFEAFVIEEIINGLNAKNSTFEHRYFRTRNGAEVDLVLEVPAGMIPIEIKFGISTDKRQLTALSQFVEREHCAFGILINNADTVAMLTENIIQIPASAI
jgi:predicted AAA+ superfamily ATPase